MTTMASDPYTSSFLPTTFSAAATTTHHPSHPPIKDAASAFLHSYARAMHLSAPTSPHRTNIPLIASALGAHYGPQTTAYTLGHRRIFPSASASASGIAVHLERFERAGLGFDIRMGAHRVDVVSDGSALCWVTWRIQPRPGCGVEPWEWENVYAYRRGGVIGAASDGECEKKRIGGEGEDDGWVKPEGYWELMLSDNEVLSVLERVPNFMQL